MIQLERQLGLSMKHVCCFLPKSNVSNLIFNRMHYLISCWRQPSLLCGKIDIDAHNILHLVPSRYVQRGREQAKENREYNHKAIKGGDQEQTRQAWRIPLILFDWQTPQSLDTYPINSGLGKQGKSGAWNCQLPMSLIIRPTLISQVGTAPNNRVAVALIHKATFLTFFANFSFHELLKYGIPD